MDHVIVHNHMHLHPTVLGLILRVGGEYGMRTTRIPEEPGGDFFLRPWLSLVRARTRRANVRSNDVVLGLRYTGEMDSERVIGLLRDLPEGTTEMYFHPATRSTPYIERELPGCRVEAEFRALIDPLVREAIRASGAQLIAFSDLHQEVPECSA